jgi:hypothetical protein
MGFSSSVPAAWLLPCPGMKADPGDAREEKVEGAARGAIRK